MPRIADTELEIEVFCVRDGRGITERTIRIRHCSGPALTIICAEAAVPAPDSSGWSAGGLGQPSFCADRWFAGIRHPYGFTAATDDGMSLTIRQHPGKRIGEGEIWESAVVVIGESPQGGVRGLFDDYVHDIAVFHPRRIWIYGDWALHDELAEKGRSVELTETMTRDNLAFLKEIDEQYGIRFDYYLVDHGWYSETSFLELKRPNFREQGLRWLSDELAEMNVKLGLWFPVNTFMISADGIYCGIVPQDFDKEQARGKGKTPYCLYSVYGGHFRESLLHAVREWGVRLIKLDFAEFGCKDPNCLHHAPAAAGTLREAILREQECEAFLDIVREVRKEVPDVAFAAYNGFNPSPWWLEWLDTLYIGDVQPSYVPATRLRASINMFTAQRLRRYEAAHHIHRDFLDDCGTFIGNTTTNFYLGKEDWRSQAILCLGRGVKLVYYYGDLRLLDDDDLTFLRQLAALDAERDETGDAYTLGPDDGSAPFVYIHGDHAAAFNPMPTRIRASWTLLSGVKLEVELDPYQAKWVEADSGKVRLMSDGAAHLRNSESIPAQDIVQTGSRFDMPERTEPGEWLLFASFSRDGKLVRTPNPSLMCRVEAEPEARVSPDHYCWNGISWLSVVLPSPKGCRPWVSFQPIGDFEGCSVSVRAWWIPQ
jgi:hypothetical protein